MKIAIPRERKILEGRIALTPQAVSELVEAGHEVYIENEAGPTEWLY
jgi:alanine dehydrogenase